MLVGVLALVAVSGVVLYRYRKVVVILPMVLVMLSELVLILGFAALAKWNLAVILSPFFTPVMAVEAVAV